MNLTKKTFVIAEIGNNHEGRFDVAKKLIFKAKQCGADAVKFQTFIPEYFVPKSNKKRYEQLKNFKLTFKQFKKLADYSKKIGIIFFSTPFDIKSAEFLNKIQQIFKISSGDNNFLPLINIIAKFNKTIFLSTGLANIKQITKVKNLILNLWKKKAKNSKKLAILHCVSSYPVVESEANLLAIKTLKSKFSDCIIGYSDHTQGILAPIIAVILGAKIIEKHFTLDKSFSSFRDHQISANPKEMREMIDKIRKAELMLGSGKKELQISEKKNIKFMRRSIVAKLDIPKGKKIELHDLNWVRLSGGLSPGNEKKIINKKSLYNIKRGTKIKLDQIK
jgi:N-acetylneuraminate synthase/N,N'-diacetyllegionaminate synthase|tara:strand:- start:390 stop:1391 length:1002 start_codon:yes stop_codon:yes gene_type:complete